jgi:triosephosphate isomerase
MRKKIVAGNWKMNMDLAEGLKFAESIAEYYEKNPPMETGVILCTPFIHLAGVAGILKGSKVACGAQNCASEPSGAYTGEVSASMVESTGAEYVIIGHSERRTYYSENDMILFRKTRLALDNDLKVIFCCGEVLEEREKEHHFLLSENKWRMACLDSPRTTLQKSSLPMSRCGHRYGTYRHPGAGPGNARIYPKPRGRSIRKRMR